jgi:hypothetical protein
MVVLPALFDRVDDLGGQMVLVSIGFGSTDDAAARHCCLGVIYGLIRLIIVTELPQK